MDFLPLIKVLNYPHPFLLFTTFISCRAELAVITEKLFIQLHRQAVPFASGAPLSLTSGTRKGESVILPLLGSKG